VKGYETGGGKILKPSHRGWRGREIGPKLNWEKRRKSKSAVPVEKQREEK